MNRDKDSYDTRIKHHSDYKQSSFRSKYDKLYEKDEYKNQRYERSRSKERYYSKGEYRDRYKERERDKYYKNNNYRSQYNRKYENEYENINEDKPELKNTQSYNSGMNNSTHYMTDLTHQQSNFTYVSDDITRNTYSDMLNKVEKPEINLMRMNNFTDKTNEVIEVKQIKDESKPEKVEINNTAASVSVPSITQEKPKVIFQANFLNLHTLRSSKVNKNILRKNIEPFTESNYINEKSLLNKIIIKEEAIERVYPIEEVLSCPYIKADNLINDSYKNYTGFFISKANLIKSINSLNNIRTTCFNKEQKFKESYNKLSFQLKTFKALSEQINKIIEK